MHDIAVFFTNINDLLVILSGILALTTWVATHFQFKNKKIATILNACLIAEKAVDREAYNSDGSFNQARLDMAMSILKVADPKLDVAATESDVEKVLANVHQALQDVPTSTTSTATTTVTNPPFTKEDANPDLPNKV